MKIDRPWWTLCRHDDTSTWGLAMVFSNVNGYRSRNSLEVYFGRLISRASFIFAEAVKQGVVNRIYGQQPKQMPNCISLASRIQTIICKKGLHVNYKLTSGFAGRNWLKKRRKMLKRAFTVLVEVTREWMNPLLRKLIDREQTENQ